MFSHVKQLFGQTLVYGLGDAASRLVAFFLLPLYTRLLTPEDYGRIAMVILMTTAIGILLNGGQNTAFFFFCFQKDVLDKRRRLTGTIVIFLVVSAFLFLAPLITIGKPVFSLLFKDQSVWPLLRIALVGTLFDAASGIPFATFRAEQRPMPYAALSLFRFLLNATLNIIAVAGMHLGAVGVIYGGVLTSAAFSVVCFAVRWRAVEWGIDWGLLRRLLRFGLPLVPAQLGCWALDLSDRFFLERYAALQQVGVYALGQQVASVVRMVMVWFNIAYAPYLFSMSTQPDVKAVHARLTIYVLTAFAGMSLGVSLIASPLLSIMAAPAYLGAASVVPLISLACLFYELDYLLSFAVDLANKTAYAPVIVGSGAVVRLALNMALIPRFGTWGAAVSMVIGYAALPAVTYFIASRVYPIRYEWKRFAKLAAVSVGVFLAGAAFRTDHVGGQVGVAAACMTLWVLTLRLSGFWTATELIKIRALLISSADLLCSSIKRFHR